MTAFGFASFFLYFYFLILRLKHFECIELLKLASIKFGAKTPLKIRKMSKFIPQSHYSEEPLSHRQQYFRQKYKLPDFVFKKRTFQKQLLPDKTKMMEIRLKIKENATLNHLNFKTALTDLEKNLNQ